MLMIARIDLQEEGLIEIDYASPLLYIEREKALQMSLQEITLSHTPYCKNICVIKQISGGQSVIFCPGCGLRIPLQETNSDDTVGALLQTLKCKYKKYETMVRSGQFLEKF